MAELLTERVAIIDTVQKFCWAIDTKKPLSAFPGAMEEVFTPDFKFGLVREQPKSVDDIPLQPIGCAGFSAFVEKVQVRPSPPTSFGARQR